jgi:hypothetical protein
VLRWEGGELITGCAGWGSGGPLAARQAPNGNSYAWILPWGLLAGTVVTLLFLAQMNWAPLPGCGLPGTPLDQLPQRCFGLWQGYPLRFVVGDQGVLKILNASAIRDWAQWTLLCCSGLYLAWWPDRPSLGAARPADGGSQGPASSWSGAADPTGNLPASG